MDQRDGQRKSLTHAKRQGVRPLIQHPRKAEARGKISNAWLDLGFRHAEQPPVQFQILAQRQLAIEREGLAHVADTTADRDVLGIDEMAEDLGLAFARGQQPRQHLHGRRLAAAVGPQKAENLAARDLEADVINGREVAEAHGQVVGPNRDLTLHTPLSRRDVQRFCATALVCGQQGDKGSIKRIGSGPGEKFGWRSRGQDAAFIHGDQPIEALGFLHIGCRDNDAHPGAVCADAVDQLPELPARQRIDARGRLVEDEEIRIVDQGTAEAQLLLHAARQLAGRPVGEGCKARCMQQAGDPIFPFTTSLAEEPAEKVDILEDRKRGVEVLAQALRHIGDTRAGFLAMRGKRHVAAQDLDPTRLNGAGARNERKQARLADAVRSDQTDHQTRRDVQRDVPQSLRLAIGKADAVEAYDRIPPQRLQNPIHFTAPGLWSGFPARGLRNRD